MGYFFRTQDLRKQDTVRLSVHTNQKQWTVPVNTFDVKTMKIKNIGTFKALEVEPVIGFVETMAKPGRVRSWVSMDPRRIPLKMTLKVPFLSHVNVDLKTYEAGTA